MRTALVTLGLGALISAAPIFAPRAAAQTPGAYTFLMITGKDTIASDVVVRTPTSVDVDFIFTLGGQHWHYTMFVTPDQRVVKMANAFYRLHQDTVPLQSADFTFDPDSVHIDISGNVSRTEVIATEPGVIPYINPSSAMIEQMLLRAKANGTGAPADTVPLFAVSGGKTLPIPITWVGGDSAVIMLGTVEMRAAIGPDGSLMGDTVPSQGIGVVRVPGAHPVVTQPIDYGAPPNAPYTAEDVTVRSPEGLTFTGTLTLPTTRKGPVPGVVTITGSGAEDRDERIPIVQGYRPFWQIADTLARRGIATLRLDDRGVNGSSRGSDTATSQNFANDIRAGLAYLAKRPEVDAKRLALVGHSEGGMIAPMVAATDSSLRGIVLMAGPAYNGRRILEYQMRNSVDQMTSLSPAQRDSTLAKSLADIDSAAAKQNWVRFFLSYNPLATARQVSVPVLILQGATDHQVTPEQADTLAAAFRAGGNHDVTERVFPNTDHLFIADSSGQPAGYSSLPSHSVRPEVLGAIADWLVKHFK